MEKQIVTSGQPFTDIDSLACALSYAQLLRLKGKDAEAVLPGPLNKSITEKIKVWNLDFATTHHPLPTNHYSYILVDISEPKFFPQFVKEKDIIEIFDHRSGFETYWKEKLGAKSRIEKVGACATLIWEQFIKRKHSQDISTTNANLLLTAIISNTLNFQASVTTERDKKAFKEISRHSNLPKNWIETYFLDQDNETDKNLANAVLNDTKIIDDIVIGQLELWDSKKIIFKYLPEIEQALRSFRRPNWFLTSPSISEGKNYLFTKNAEVKKLLEKLINAKFAGDIGITDKLWLRKEILNLIK